MKLNISFNSDNIIIYIKPNIRPCVQSPTFQRMLFSVTIQISTEQGVKHKSWIVWGGDHIFTMSVARAEAQLLGYVCRSRTKKHLTSTTEKRKKTVQKHSGHCVMDSLESM